MIPIVVSQTRSHRSTATAHHLLQWVIRDLNHDLIPGSGRTGCEPRLVYSLPTSAIQAVGQLNLNIIGHLVENVKKPDPRVAHPELNHPIQIVVEVVLLIWGKQ